MSDPEWAEFEQLNSKTTIRPRSDFEFDFPSDQFAAIGAKLNIDFVSGISYRIGDIVFSESDSLIYRCIKETDSVSPDYTNATSNLYWTWRAGSISAEVSGRGWWTKFPDRSMHQTCIISIASIARSTAYGAVYRTGLLGPGTWPVAFASIHSSVAHVQAANNAGWIMDHTTAATVSATQDTYLIGATSLTLTGVVVAFDGWGEW